MRLLSIETSCDDTCIAIVEVFDKEKPRFKILSNIVSSQVEIHKKWGGVYPSLAKREHQRNLVVVLTKALKETRLLNLETGSQNAKLQCKSQNLKKILEREINLSKKLIAFLERHRKPDIDAIAMTVGPGLEPCLWVGVNFARALSYYWELPLIPVNHIEAHILANWLKINKKITFPSICLVASGGHTQLILMKKIGTYEILGETRDDAAGECFDKVARILGLGYPGGPLIAAETEKFKAPEFQIKLPRPMIKTKDYDFSFSGLKTAVLYDFRNRPEKVRKSKAYLREICFETQQAVVDVLLKKTEKAAKDYKAKTIILGGGVVANNELRKQFKFWSSRYKINVLVPSKNLCTDNSVMVAISGYFHWLKKDIENFEKIKARANIEIE